MYLFHTQNTQQHLSLVRTGTMFEDIYPLPGAQQQISIINGNRQAGVCQHGADVGGGIVIAFERVRVPTVPLRDKSAHKSFQVGAGSRVPVFAHDQRGAGVRQEQEAHAFTHVPIP